MKAVVVGIVLAAATAAAQPVPDEPPVPPDQPPTTTPAQPAPPTQPTPPPVQPLPPGKKYEPLIRTGIAPDLTVAGGVRVAAGDNDHVRRFMGRLRAGVTLFSEPNFLVAGITGQINTLDSSSLGFELQYINMISGLWLQGGIAPFDTHGGTVLTLGAGYALLGVEYQRRISGDQKDEQTFTLMVNVPLGVIRVYTR